MARTFFVLIVLAFSLLACGVKETPAATETITPQPSPTATPAAVPTATQTLIPHPVALDIAYKNCPAQKVFLGQQMVIEHGFRFGKKGFAQRIVKEGVETVSINGSVTILNDPLLWSPITPEETENLGTFYLTTFRWDLPDFGVGTYQIDVKFFVPTVTKGPLFLYCSKLEVLPR